MIPKDLLPLRMFNDMVGVFKKAKLMKKAGFYVYCGDSSNRSTILRPLTTYEEDA
jgi:hypothetical protein